jgi:DNA-binding transcriptional MocR family regulator
MQAPVRASHVSDGLQRACQCWDAHPFIKTSQNSYNFTVNFGPSHWILDGTGESLLAAVRRESIERQRLAASILPPGLCRADPVAFHLWVSLPAPWTRSAFVAHMRATGVGVVASDAFATDAPPPEAVRVCLGGPADRASVRGALEFMAHALTEQPALASTFL